MKPGYNHIIVDAESDKRELLVEMQRDGLLELTTYEMGTHPALSFALNHDTARELFGLLGQYLHAFPSD